MVTIIKQSILEADTDVIVNAANGHLRHGGGVARLIADAARGPVAALDEYDPVATSWSTEQEAHPLVATGDVGVTSAGHLPFKVIIHAVGPVWGGGGFYERELLYSAFASAMAKAEDLGYASLAFPAISAGIFGCPIDVVAEEAMYASREFPDLDIRFYILDDEQIAAFETAKESM